MNILIDSYNTVCQNGSGGIQVRIKNVIKHSKCIPNLTYHLYNKWEDYYKDFDILHIFKANIENYHSILYAKSIGIPVVLSSVIPLEKRINIIVNIFISYFFPIQTGYSIIYKSLRLADAVISQTEREASFIHRYYFIRKSKIHVIPNGVTTHKPSNYSQIYSRLRISNDYIMQVGRFDKNKNQLSVIKAMKNTGVPVVFIGGPDPNDQLYYDQCVNEATPNMYFMGWINNEDPLMASAYVNAKVVILPSHKEIFGNSLIEGAAAGANLVATRELPIAEWGLEDYCDTINPNNINDIRKKLLSAFTKSKNSTLPKLISKKFSWEKVMSDHYNLYKHIINRH